MLLKASIPCAFRQSTQLGISRTAAYSGALLRNFSSTSCRPDDSPASSVPATPILGRYSVTPVELFRVNSGQNVILTDYATQRSEGRSWYDLRLGPDGLVHPSKSQNYEGPNGASVRPMGPTLQELVRTKRTRGCTVWRLPKGVNFPPELVLLQHHSDQYSIQTTAPVKLEVFNERVSNFLKVHGESMDKKEFCDKYPF